MDVSTLSIQVGLAQTLDYTLSPTKATVSIAQIEINTNQRSGHHLTAEKKMDREKIVDYLEKQINAHIEFDNCPGNEDGWHEVTRKNIYKIVDGLIPMIKKELKTTQTPRQVMAGMKRDDDSIFNLCNTFNHSLCNAVLRTIQ